MTNLPEPIAVTFLVIDVFDKLGIPYFVGGSLAAAAHGVARATLDTDVIADLTLEKVEPFVEALQADFYVDSQMVVDAIITDRSFNLIHLNSMFKVDVFILTERPFERSELERRELHELSETPGYQIYITSPEDLTLAKLEWYRAGGEVSERQWRDVIGVLAVQGEALEIQYMRKWAKILAIADLLERTIHEAGLQELM